MLAAPPDGGEAVALEKGPNIKDLPRFDPLPDDLGGEVLLKVGDDVSTDEIMPAGAQILPYRSNIPEISKFAFSRIEEGFYERALPHRKKGFFVVGGFNYGQGSSREHAAIAPRHLGLRAVVARSFARIHWQNLANFGMLPMTFVDPQDYERIEQGDSLEVDRVREALQKGKRIDIKNVTRNEVYPVAHHLSGRQLEMVLAGSLINVVRDHR
jgi:aconitate hydratase